MRYLRKFVPRAGLMSALLISGVLGGLMAPPLSEAVPPEITLLIDNQSTLLRSDGTTVSGNSILNLPVACSGTDIGLGYTNCYSIVTSTTVAYRANNGRLYRIQNAPNSTARLRVGDNPGQDHLSLVGVQFVPVNTANQGAPAPTSTVALNTLTNWGSPDANTTETHTLNISIKNTFNSTVNSNNATTYTNNVANENTKLPAAIRMGGHFTTGIVDTNTVATPNPLFCGPSTTAGAAGTVKCDTVGNRVQYSAQGKFKDGVLQPVLSPAGSANNTSPLSFTVGDTAANKALVSASFDGLSNAKMGQVDPTYPKFECRTGLGSTTCQEEVTQTITVTLKGPDTFVLASGADCFLARCNAQDQTRLTRLFTLISNVVAFLNWWENTHDNPRLRELIDRAQAFLANFNTTPSDPNCPATRLIQAQMLFNALIDQRTFALVGALPGDPAPPAPETGTIRIIKNTSGPGGGETSDTFTFNISGPSPSTASIPMGNMNSNSTVVTVEPGDYSVSENPLAGWTLNRGEGQNGAPRCTDGEVTFGTIEFTVPSGGNVTCTFNNSPATGIKLSWGGQPLDLDSHLHVPTATGYHVFYPLANRGSLGSSPFAALDLDDTDGFGPEIITVVRWMKGTYQYFVHNFSVTFSPGMTGSPARVDLIQGSTITNTYSPPAGEGSNLYWHVFNVVVDETCAVSIVQVNQWLASPPMQTSGSEVLCP